MQWPSVPLGELAQIVGGSTPRRDNPEYWGGHIPWVTPSDLRAPGSGIGCVDSTTDYITEEGLTHSSASLLPEGTVLFSSRATIGKLGIASMPLATNQGFANFIPSPCIESRFLAYSLLLHTARIAALAGTTTFIEVTKGAIRGFSISLPPWSEQRRIVEILDQADALRRKRAEADALAARILPALFVQMFGDPATNQMGWPVVPLDKAVRFVGGGTPARANPEFFTGTIPWATSKDIKADYLTDTQEHITEDAIARSATNLVPAGTVLIVVKSKILMRKLPVAIAEVPVCFGQDLKGLICVNGYMSEYISATLRAREQSILVQARGVNTEGLTLDILKRVPVLDVPRLLQEPFARAAAMLRKVATGRDDSSQTIERLWANLLHRAFTGELTVRWREAHREQLEAEMAEQQRLLAAGRAGSGDGAAPRRTNGRGRASTRVRG
jgi:type I restriction enzyme S subunit